ncbi:MAG: AsnC family transcriptional regulator [Hydrocarboniphaga sp.]|uniref:Lrp/AsnC family transcriptional regulator n=1 Tax=Hydrocarboniphaga sp. TaxID=2033016 RepID=UPI00261C91D3|nr:Lrp/AsnC family transcriptional regulator [Hydrocarboniphaga sp.]MDB5969974.1 AsnC family transcriptional regulator [Hydrocarboniphaga sp.]
MKLDDIDNAILAALGQNGRMSNREVGRDVGVSEGTVRQRLKKLEAAKAMRLGLVVDITVTGRVTVAYVRIKAKPDRIRAIAKEIAAMDDCSFVGLSVGSFDIVTLFNARTRGELAEYIDNRIAKISGVLAIDVREPIASIKHRYDLIHVT